MATKVLPSAKLIEIDIKGTKRVLTHFNKIISNFPQMTEDLMIEYAKDIKKYAKANVESRATYKSRYKFSSGKAVESGTLKESINVLNIVMNDNEVKVEVGVEPSSPASKYAYFFEYGYHGFNIIYPHSFFGFKSGYGYLRFYWEDGPKGPDVYFYKSVKRGHYEGRYFMRDAVIQAADEWRTKLEQETGKLIKK